MRSFPWLVTDARLKTTIPRMEQGESTLEMVGRMLGRKLFVFFFSCAPSLPRRTRRDLQNIGIFYNPSFHRQDPHNRTPVVERLWAS